jgi:hypothetical protein
MFLGWHLGQGREVLKSFLVFALSQIQISPKQGIFFNVDLANKSNAQAAHQLAAPRSRYL